MKDERSGIDRVEGAQPGVREKALGEYEYEHVRMIALASARLEKLRLPVQFPLPFPFKTKLKGAAEFVGQARLL